MTVTLLTVNGVSAGVTTNYVQPVGYYPHGGPQFWQYGNGLWNWQNVNNPSKAIRASRRSALHRKTMAEIHLTRRPTTWWLWMRRVVMRRAGW